MPLTGTIGQPIHYHDSYLLKDEALPNAGTKYGEEKTLNNTLASLQIRGTLNGALTVPTDSEIAIGLQYKNEAGGWVTEKTLFSGGAGTLEAGDIFKEVVTPSREKRDFRIEVVTDFDASGVTISCPIELIPR